MRAVIAAAGFCGLIVGCYLNTLVYRLQASRPLVTQDCFCPACGHPLTLWEQIPVLGYLLLHGKCRWCGAPIALHYPLVEAGCAVLYAGLAALLPGAGRFAAVCFLAAMLIAGALLYREDADAFSERLRHPVPFLRGAGVLAFYHLLIAVCSGIVRRGTAA